jgi:hypothetical protein
MRNITAIGLAFVSGLVGVSVGSLVQPARAVDRIVEAEEFRLVDSDGLLRGRWYTEESTDKRVVLSIAINGDQDYEERERVRVYTSGESGNVSLGRTGSANRAIFLRADGDTSCTISLWGHWDDDDTEVIGPRVTLDGSEDAKRALRILRHNGRKRFSR